MQPKVDEKKLHVNGLLTRFQEFDAVIRRGSISAMSPLVIEDMLTVIGLSNCYSMLAGKDGSFLSGLLKMGLGMQTQMLCGMGMSGGDKNKLIRALEAIQASDGDTDAITLLQGAAAPVCAWSSQEIERWFTSKGMAQLQEKFAQARSV